MNIIFVSNSMSKAKTLSVFQVALIILGLMSGPLFFAFLIIVPQEPSVKQGVKSLIPSRLFSFNMHQKTLDAYAIQLGEMQARMMRLDAQSGRLAQLADGKLTAKPLQNKGVDKKKSNTIKANTIKATDDKLQKPNRGGPLVLDAPLTEVQLQKRIAELVAQIENQSEFLSDVEAKLLQKSVLKETLPNISPVNVAFNSSSFGWRIDPFNGHSAFHEGLDFTAVVGTPIYSAADGIVSAAGQTPDYGKIVKIDHGLGLETRYAHASSILVKVGERIEKGQKIAEVGSTGRSTGPHLHYEIRLDGNPLDPRKYLKATS